MYMQAFQSVVVLTVQTSTHTGLLVIKCFKIHLHYLQLVNNSLQIHLSFLKLLSIQCKNISTSFNLSRLTPYTTSVYTYAGWVVQVQSRSRSNTPQFTAILIYVATFKSQKKTVYRGDSAYQPLFACRRKRYNVHFATLSMPYYKQGGAGYLISVSQ